MLERPSRTPHATATRRLEAGCAWSPRTIARLDDVRTRPCARVPRFPEIRPSRYPPPNGAQKKPLLVVEEGFLAEGPGGDLLSHGEAPHYHRRYTVSLLSSGWDQVVPVLCGRQEKGWLRRGVRRGRVGWIAGADAVRAQAECLGVIWSSRTVN